MKNKTGFNVNASRLIVVVCLMLLVFFYFQGENMRKQPKPKEVSYSTIVSEIRLGNAKSVEYQLGTAKLTAVMVHDGAKNSGVVVIDDSNNTKTFEELAVDHAAKLEAVKVKSGSDVPEATGETLMTIAPISSEMIDEFSKLTDVKVSHKPKESQFLNYAMPIFTVVLMVVLFYYFMVVLPSKKGGAGGMGGPMAFARSKAKKMEKNINVTMADVAGCDEAKEEVRELVEFLKNPQKFEALGASMPKGYLLNGPPGTGKTLLAKAVAGEAQVPFFSVSGSDFVEMFVGVGASRVRDMFEKAKENAPCILFIDEFDVMAKKRSSGAHGGGGTDEREQTLNQLLVEMDGFETNSSVVIIAATNRIDMLDDAVKRPGRFDRQIEVALPDRAGRMEILKVHAKSIIADVSVDWEKVARGTPGFSGAELKNVINEAAIFAVREGAKFVSQKHIEEARDRVMMGARKTSAIKNMEERKITAYHEAGHAIVAHCLKAADPVHRISIVARGRALGVTMQLPEDERMNSDEASLRARITVLMGGRAAEDVALNVKTAGASNDFARASRLARMMVTSLGMDDEIGVVSMDGEYGPQMGYDNGWSEEFKRRADSKVSKILRDEYDNACKILRENYEAFDRVSLALLEAEDLDDEQFIALFEGKMTVEDFKPKKEEVVVAKEPEVKNENVESGDFGGREIIMD